MTIILFTDASTKNGYSCIAYLSSFHNKTVTEVYLSPNSSAMEVLAIVKGLESLPAGSEVFVISDFLSAVRLINCNKIVNLYKNRTKGTQYWEICTRLIEQLNIYTVQAVWVPSKCPLKGHVEVDQMSKVTLNDFLKNNSKIDWIGELK